MKAKPKKLDDFPIETLIRLWFRILWQVYDAGGISVGRSTRCNLLDCYLEFVPIPRSLGNLEEYYEHSIEAAILKRPILSIDSRKVVVLKEIPRYSKKRISRAGLGALLALEWSVHADVAWRNGYEVERKRIKEILDRFDFLSVSPEDNLEAVIKALLQRKSDIEYKENQERFNQPLGENE